MAKYVFVRGNNSVTVHVTGLSDVISMLHKMKSNLKNISGVLNTWRNYTQNMVGALIKNGVMTGASRPGHWKPMTRLTEATARLRLRGIYRIGDLPWTAPATTKPLFARGDYYRSWKNHKHKDRADRLTSKDASSAKGAELLMVNTSVKTAHEEGYTNTSRIFFRRSVPARPVPNIFTNKLVDEMFVPVFLQRIFAGTGVKSLRVSGKQSAGQIVTDTMRGDRYV